MADITSRDVCDVVSKLSSDKAKIREDGVKLLNTCLEGERLVGFCRFLSQRTAKLTPDDVPNSDTWPFLIKLLVQCVSLEVSGSKRRAPKLSYAKTLRIVIQKAEDTKFPGKMLPLLSVVKTLFSHVYDILSNVPSFQLEYGIILRHLLAVRDYRFHMRKRIYCSLMLLYIEKVETSLLERSSNEYNQKEDVFRSILTLQSLLDNPPGDFPDNLREDVMRGFVRIFSSVRDEGKTSRKLIECVNTFLQKDGPNLGSQFLEVHNAVQKYFSGCWLTTHDRSLKDQLILYLRLHLNLRRSTDDGNPMDGQLLDMVYRELDLSSSSCSAVTWGDASKDDKFGTLSSSQRGLVELAALVFYQACVNSARAVTGQKRAKREHASSRMKEAVCEGKWLWSAAFSCLIHNYSTRISTDLLLYWFDAICTNFERILNDANSGHAYDGLLWTLRALHVLHHTLLPSEKHRSSEKSANKENISPIDRGLQLIWSCLLHALPVFINVTAVVDAALILLGRIVLNDQLNVCVVPQDVWDHRLFKQMPSESVLCFVACYFSRRGSHGDLRDDFYLRRNLLRSLLGSLNLKGFHLLNEKIILLTPAAIYALCAGCAPFIQVYGGDLFSYTDSANDWFKKNEHELEVGFELSECSVELLTRISLGDGVEASTSQPYRNVRLPRQLRDPLLQEMKIYVLKVLEDKDTEKTSLSAIFFMCAFLSNIIYGSSMTRMREELSSFLSDLGQHLLDLLNHAISIVLENQSDLQSLKCLGSGSGSELDERSSVVTSMMCFVRCPALLIQKEQSPLGPEIYDAIFKSLRRLLMALSKLYKKHSLFERNLQSDIHPSRLAAPDSPFQSSCPPIQSRIMDIELDMDVDTKDVDIIVAGGTMVTGISFCSVKWKLGMISLMSCLFSVLHVLTWDTLFDLMENEFDSKVSENIMYNLCQHPHWSSCTGVTNLVKIMNRMIDIQVKLKLDLHNIIAALCCLVGAFLSFVAGNSGEDKYGNLPVMKGEPGQCFIHVGEMVNRVSEVDLLDWFGRVKLINCICDFILLDPQIGLTMIERLLMMLRDTDYRVRFVLGGRIGLLFQKWDGHEALFQDIRSNFGVMLVGSSKEELVTAADVLAAGPQPRLTVETIIVTLMHLALHSEKIELQAVFMLCAISAIDPCQRELVRAALDNLSRQLQYSTRFKVTVIVFPVDSLISVPCFFHWLSSGNSDVDIRTWLLSADTSASEYLEELLGSILFYWFACGVSLVALVEIRQLFISDAEPNQFIRICSQWLFPALLLHEDNSNLNWVAKIAGKSLATLVKEHFVPIFSICMALHCSKAPASVKNAAVLQSSILHLGEISENERDKLIKKNMVSIVSHILSLASCDSEPAIPFFARDTVTRAVQTVVDGFLEMDACPINAGVVDKINIFRPDRVFMFIVEMHYKIAAAIHPRHRCNHLAVVEVLISIIRHRAAIASTSNYLFHLIGQHLGCVALQDQCCRIISCLLDTFKTNPSMEVIHVLGETLQFLVSKLVACCIPSEGNVAPSGAQSSQVLSLLHQLTVNADPSLYDYIRDLEPFPEIDMFDEIRKFHMELCQAYSPRDHLLKFVKRSFFLPPRLLSWSLQALHKKLLTAEAFQRDKVMEAAEVSYWHCDIEVVNIVWTLVRMSAPNDANSIRSLVSDFLSRVGISNPHSVVFHLPGDFSRMHVCQPIDLDSGTERNISMDTGISEEILIALLKVLKKYLMDDSVKIVDMTSRTLRGILSTEKGQKALSSLDTYERSLVEVHSKGINVELVEKVLLDLQIRFKADAISLETHTVWSTNNITFETWICQLVYLLIGYCNDVIIRLCQDIALLKAEIAELLLPSVIVSLAGMKDVEFDLHKLLSSQVEKYIFTDSNKLIKSIQILLNALNELRIWYVAERKSSGSLKGGSSKIAKPSSYSSRSRSSSGKKVKESSTLLSAMPNSTSTFSWDKVYWLSIDYLVVAKSAVACGAYFTSLMYVEHWCEEHFGGLTLGKPDFSHLEMLPRHVEILVSAITQINEPDSLYGAIQSNKLTSQIITFEHEGNWSKALEYYDLQVRSETTLQAEGGRNFSMEHAQPASQLPLSMSEEERMQRKPYKGLIRSLQQTGCMHVLDQYCQGLTSQKGQFQHDSEFIELQYEAAWHAGNWDFSLLSEVACFSSESMGIKNNHFNENLHSCLRALHVGDVDEFHSTLKDSKEELLCSVSHASEESTVFIYSTIIKLQILYHLGLAWDIRWTASSCEILKVYPLKQKAYKGPVVPTMDQLSWLNMDWSSILKQTQLHMNLLEPFIAFRRVLLEILGCKDSTIHHHLQSASALRKGFRFSQAAASLHEFKIMCTGTNGQNSTSYWLGRLEEAKLLRAQGQHEMAINLANYISQNYQLNEEASDAHRLAGKWLAETRSSNSRTILEKYLKPAVTLAEDQNITHKSIKRQSQAQFHLAHYADALFRSYEDRLSSNEWQAAIRLRKHKTRELEALIKRYRSSTKGDKTDYSLKIQELQKQLTMDKEEAEKLQDDRDNFLNLALEGYKSCLVIGDKYDVRVVFRLVSLWFGLSSRKDVIDNLRNTIEEVQSHKFIPLVYQIASRMGSAKDGSGPHNFQFTLVSLIKKMAIDHPYHTIFQLLALANGDRIKNKQRSRNSFVVDMDKKNAAEKLLLELSGYHGSVIRQMKQMVEIYIKLAELETRREDTNKRITLPREIRSLRMLDLVPVVTATFPVDRSCQYGEGSFPYFKGLSDSVTVMNGINAPKVVECLGSDGRKYKQLAKSGNDDLRQDAVMEQFFGLVNTFLQNNRDTWKRRLGVRTYKVVPFTPSAGVLEWVEGTTPLGDYLIGSTRSGGAHSRYGLGDWSYPKCREHISNEKDKRGAFQEVCLNFRPVMHYFFLERFLQPADWFEKRLAYTRSVAASSMVGYIVGLGDRHAMNILIDQATAEVVHIDLGVAFEQGLMLKTPERVPFRLTRDIIDGMGVTGVEGVFRRCCEETLSVMRTNKEALLTIVEVFIHDPLYKWALSPLKALQRQKETIDDLDLSLEGSQEEYEGNKDATRALMRVKQKLDGYEEGEMRSIHGQVQQLIQDAIDPERLCQMFPGWGSWM